MLFPASLGTLLGGITPASTVIAALGCRFSLQLDRALRLQSNSFSDGTAA